MPTEVERIQASLERAHRRVDIGRMKKIRLYLNRANDIILAGEFHNSAHEAIANNIIEESGSTISRLTEVINAE